MTVIKKNSEWSIKLNKNPLRKSLTVTAVKKDRVEFIVLKFPDITWALPKDRFLEHFEPTRLK